MKNNQTKIIQMGVFVLYLAMVALFSVGTIFMLQVKEEKDEGRLIQFGTAPSVSVVIDKFEFTKNKVKSNEFLPVDLKWSLYTDDNKKEITDRYEVYGADIWATNTANGQVFYGSTSNCHDNECTEMNQVISTTQSAGVYKITSLTVRLIKKGDPSQRVVAILYFNVNDNCHNVIECENMTHLQKTFTIVEDSSEDKVPIYEYSVSLDETDPEVYVGDQVNLSIHRVDKVDEVSLQRKDLKNMLLSYTNEKDGNVINVYVKAIDEKPYIIVPSTATVGKYNLDYGYLTFVDDTSERYKNTATKKFAYNASFIVKEKPMDTSKYVFSNEKYGKDVIDTLNKLDDDAIVVVDANTMPLIDEGVFSFIRDTKRTLIIEYQDSQWIFNGLDINNPKVVDVRTILTKLTKDSDYYNSFLKENVQGPSAMLQFSENGDLPGKTLIKIDKASVDTLLNNPDNIYVYYYKEDTDQLVKVAMEIQSNDGFYEFYINHNSKYIMTTKEIVTDIVSEDVDMLSLNHQLVIQQQQQQMPILYILGTVCGILAMGLVIVLGRKRHQQQQQQQL